MHIAPVVLIPHAVGASGWVEAMTILAECLDRHPTLIATVRIPGAALEHVAREESGIWKTLETERVRWLAGGFTDPILSSLPPAAASLQLERETLAMDAAGVTPAGLWVGDAWEPGLIGLAAESALPLILFEASLVDRPPDRPGAVDRAGEAVIAVPVRETLPDSPQDDQLAAVKMPVERLEDLVRSHPGRLVSPDSYLNDHGPGDRLGPPVASPERHPEREAFYRKLLVLTRDQGDRSTGRDTVLRLQSREHILEVDSGEADRELIASRRALDRSRHRGDSWVEVREIDWDADALEEVWVETADHTLVVDPPDGSFDVWDDKAFDWPITAVVPALPGVIGRRLADDGQEAPSPPMALEGRTEGKSYASVTLTDAMGGSCRLEVTGRTVSLELTIAPTDRVRLGPEIPVNLNGARVRVDGGAWMEADQPVALAGHRFRITDGLRTMLIAAPRPCELFVRPLAGRGMVIWPHWMTRGDATYRLALTPS